MLDGTWKQDQHWKVVNGGATKISNTPEDLWQKAIDYFKWCDENPITAKRTLTGGKNAGDKKEVEFVRPYTIEGFCLHAGISKTYLKDIINTHDKSTQWHMVAEKISYIIYTQNLEGAIVDLYNPIMVSKVLNMDKGDKDDDKPVRVEIIDASETDKIPNSENEVLQNLDFEKVRLLKDKTQNHEREKSI